MEGITTQQEVKPKHFWAIRQVEGMIEELKSNIQSKQDAIIRLEGEIVKDQASLKEFRSTLNLLTGRFVYVMKVEYTGSKDYVKVGTGTAANVTAFQAAPVLYKFFNVDEEVVRARLAPFFLGYSDLGGHNFYHFNDECKKVLDDTFENS